MSLIRFCSSKEKSRLPSVVKDADADSRLLHRVATRMSRESCTFVKELKLEDGSQVTDDAVIVVEVA